MTPTDDGYYIHPVYGPVRVVTVRGSLVFRHFGGEEFTPTEGLDLWEPIPTWGETHLLRKSSLAALQVRVGEVNTANGWRKPPNPDFVRDVARSAIALGDLTMAIESVRRGTGVDTLAREMKRIRRHEMAYKDTPQRMTVVRLLLIATEIDEAIDAVLDPSCAGHVPEVPAFDEELADVVIRTLELADTLGIDLERAVESKLRFNLGRGYRHGGKLI